MPRKTYIVYDPENLTDLVVQLNRVLDEITVQLQRIEGLDGYTTEFYGDIQHKTTTAKLGFFNTTKVVQQSAIADAETSHSTATTSDLDALGTKINAVRDAIEAYGLIESS